LIGDLFAQTPKNTATPYERQFYEK